MLKAIVAEKCRKSESGTEREREREKEGPENGPCTAPGI